MLSSARFQSGELMRRTKIGTGCSILFGDNQDPMRKPVVGTTLIHHPTQKNEFLDGLPSPIKNQVFNEDRINYVNSKIGIK